MKWLSFLVIGVLLMSGCAGNSNPPGLPTGGQPASGAASAGQSVLQFADLDSDVETIITADGTVNFQDSCNTGGCITSTDWARHATDITASVPQNVPVEISVEMKQEPDLLFGNYDIWIEAPESTFYYVSQEANHAVGSSRLNLLMRAVGQVTLVLFANAPGGDVPSTDYTLRATVIAGPQRVSPGAPVGLELKPGSNVTFQAPGQTNPEFMLFAPDDSLLGTFAGTATLPATAKAGEYVVLLPRGSSWGNLSTDSGATTMRAIGLTATLGPVGTIPPRGSYANDWIVEGFPAAVGISAFTAGGSAIGSPLISIGFDFNLIGANGYKLESGPNCGLCLSFGDQRWTLYSGTGQQDVVGQTYQVKATSALAYDVRVAPFAVFFDRV